MVTYLNSQDNEMKLGQLFARMSHPWQSSTVLSPLFCTERQGYGTGGLIRDTLGRLGGESRSVSRYGTLKCKLELMKAITTCHAID